MKRDAHATFAAGLIYQAADITLKSSHRRGGDCHRSSTPEQSPTSF
jgi:hypothetical protein